MDKIIYTTPPCSVCNVSSDIELDKEKFERWQAGELIQRVWPEMPKEEREVLITGTHGKCWDEMFSGEEW